MGNQIGWHIIELDSFDTAFPVDPGGEDDVKRRFMTLFSQINEPVRVGGTSYVSKVASYTGETFALKRLMLAGVVPEGTMMTPEESERITTGTIAAFREEYKNQLLVSRLRGFPRLYGYGSIDGDPVILMEWVDGVSLREWARRMAEQGETASAQTIAAIGAAVLHALETAARLDNALVHRDISPANIMMRTDASSVDEQVDRNAFDICLVDFGSSAQQCPDDPSFTQINAVWRNGTPDYAAPEMLTRDAPGIDALRQSHAVDVFALCSVLYELYAGHLPWSIAQHPETTPYRLKVDTEPEPLEARSQEDAAFVEALMRGLAASQEERPTLEELLTVFQQTAGTDLDVPLSHSEGEGAGESPLNGGTHLEMAPVGEGGRRAHEITGESRPRANVSRRRFVTGAAIFLAGIAVGGLAIRNLSGNGYDFSGYPQAAAPFEGLLYPAMHLANNTWVLREAGSAREAALAGIDRNPGRFASGVVRGHDTASGRYGFLTAVENDASLDSAWLVLPRFVDAGDFPSDAVDGTPALAPVKEESGGLWGYCDKSGGIAIEARFAGAGRFHNGFAAIQEERGGLWGVVDARGSIAVKPGFRRIGAHSSDGIAPACDHATTLWGYLGPDGTWILPATLRYARQFTEGLAACRPDSANGLWGYIDAEGTQRIKPSFADALPFADGLAPAQDVETKLWGLIDASGNWEVKPLFLAIGAKTGRLFPAHGSPAGVYDIDGAERKAWETYLETATDEAFGYGYIDGEGHWTIAPVYGNTLPNTSA